MIVMSFDDKALKRALELFPKELKYNLGDAFDHIGRSFVGSFRKKKIVDYLGRAHRPIGIFKQTRRASIVPNSGIDSMGVKVWIDSPNIAPRLQFGASVMSKKHGGMAVPLSSRREMFTRGGRLRKKYRDPDRLKNIFSLESKGNVFLVERKKGELIFRYVLKKSVKVKAQLQFYQTMDEKRNRNLQILNKAVGKTIRETF